ncbi:MAG: hypothetical protein HY678_02690 [Chloroflexi bacterium]|nr:hypothetical protein [Chloroflexota bacterium]
MAMVRGNLRHEPIGYPFYFLDPACLRTHRSTAGSDPTPDCGWPNFSVVSVFGVKS